MKNSKLNLNKATISNLSSEELLNAQGGLGPGGTSSKKHCCNSIAHDDFPSSRRHCCSCDVDANPGEIAGLNG